MYIYVTPTLSAVGKKDGEVSQELPNEAPAKWPPTIVCYVSLLWNTKFKHKLIKRKCVMSTGQFVALTNFDIRIFIYLKFS